MYVLENLVAQFRYSGTVGFVFWITRQFLFRVCRWETILLFRKELSFPVGEVNVSIPVVYQKIKPGALNHRLQHQKSLRKMIGNDFPAGCECVVGEYKRKIIYFAWINYQRIYDRYLLNFHLPPKTAYVYRVYTLPGFRGKGVARAGYGFISKFLAEQHRQQCFVAVSFVNQPSIRAIENAGFRRMARFSYVNLPHRRIFVFENVRNRLGKVREK